MLPIPGWPATGVAPQVCGHGNREFSFLARRGKSVTKLLVVLFAGVLLLLGGRGRGETAGGEMRDQSAALETSCLLAG